MAQSNAIPAVRINGPALRAIRERSGVSCTALARAVGADHSFLARIERGEKRGMRGETYDRIVAELGIDPRAILADPFGTLLGLTSGTPLGTVVSSTTRTAA